MLHAADFQAVEVPHPCRLAALRVMLYRGAACSAALSCRALNAVRHSQQAVQMQACGFCR